MENNWLNFFDKKKDDRISNYQKVNKRFSLRSSSEITSVSLRDDKRTNLIRRKRLSSTSTSKHNPVSV